MKRRGSQTLDSLLDVRDALALVIHDAWVGYNEHSPIVGVYDLARAKNGSFACIGRLSTSLAGERVVDVTIAAGAATRFLNAVAGAVITEGAYEALQDHTDDYPHIEVALHVGPREVGRSGGIALLFTESQGEFHAPWGACVGGRMWTLPGEEVGRAIASLRGPLKVATLDRMLREADGARNRVASKNRGRRA